MEGKSEQLHYLIIITPPSQDPPFCRLGVFIEEYFVYLWQITHWQRKSPASALTDMCVSSEDLEIKCRAEIEVLCNCCYHNWCIIVCHTFTNLRWKVRPLTSDTLESFYFFFSLTCISFIINNIFILFCIFCSFTTLTCLPNKKDKEWNKLFWIETKFLIINCKRTKIIKIGTHRKLSFLNSSSSVML